MIRHCIFPDTPRQVPHSRWLNVACRTVHLGATGVLLGAHWFHAPADALYPFLGVAIGSGAGMILLELSATAHWAHQICALVVYAKLALLCLMPFFWDARVPMLLAVVALASVGAHAPRRVRHYSIVYRKVMVD